MSISIVVLDVVVGILVALIVVVFVVSIVIGFVLGFAVVIEISVVLFYIFEVRIYVEFNFHLLWFHFESHFLSPAP